MGFRNPVRSLRADQITPGTLPAGVVLPVNSVDVAQIVANAVTGIAIAPSAITTVAIAPNAIVAGAIAANAVVAGTIAANAVTTATIAAGAITAAKIAAGTITATELSATAIDGSVITGATIRTAATGQRVVMYSGGLVGYNSSGTAVTTISAATGALTATGADIIGTLRTGVAGARVEIGAGQLVAYDTGTGSVTLNGGQVLASSTFSKTATLAWNKLSNVGGDLALDSSGNIHVGGGGIFLDSPVASSAIKALTLPTASFLGPVGIDSTGALGRITGTIPVANIPYVTGSATTARLFTGTDPDAGYTFRITATPVAGIYSDATALLYVNSAAQVYAPPVYSNAISTRAVYVASTGALGTTSSLRAHKCAIDDVSPDVVDALLALRPVTFLRVADPDGRREVGLIAEEAVEAGMPDEFLYLSDEGALDGLAYERLPVYLVTALQHLHARLTQLEGAA